MHQEIQQEMDPVATLIGGPTVLLEVGGLRLLTDPTFDPADSRYAQGPVRMHKLHGPALTPEQLGRVDAVLLSHDTHEDNLDAAGRAFLPRAGRVLTTPSGAQRLGGGAVGLQPWESVELPAPNGGRVRITATPARHGPPGTERLLGEVTGFVVAWDGAPEDALYVSGDTVWFDGLEEVARRFRVGTAVLSVGGAGFEALGPVRLTMDAAEAARLTRVLGARRVVPVHCEGWAHYREGRAPLEHALAEAGLGERLVWLEPGVRTRLAGR